MVVMAESHMRRRDRPSVGSAVLEVVEPLTGHPAIGRLQQRSGLVLLVGDVFAPGDGATGVIGLLDRDVDHEAVWCGAVPVVLAGLEEHTVAGADDLDGAALALAEAVT